MKWSQYGRITLALVASLALGLSITACNPSFTLGFVYALNTKFNPGQINAYTIDSVSGALTQTANSPFNSGGQYPVADAVDNRSKWLYVVHEIDNTVVQFSIGTDGKLYKQHTYNTPGTYPIATAIDSQSKYLFVVDSYAPGFNGVAPPNVNPICGGVVQNAGNLVPAQASCANTVATQGCVVVYPISFADGSLGTPVSKGGQRCFPIGPGPVLGSQPIGVTATSFVNYLYVADQGTHTVYAYSVDYANGQLTPLPTNNFQAGVKPSAILSDPSGRFVYVTDEYANQLLGFDILTNGALQSMVNGPFATDLFPYAMAIDPRGKFLYVTNYNANDVRAYVIDPATGNPTGTTTGSYGTGTSPTCITIEPAYGRFVYTANFIDNSVSGFELDPKTGALTTVLNSPFPATGNPTCIAAAANGTHPVQNIVP
ncbi:MAG TPA: beta-propeller fold lactonase family protein [Acidobacteriaceae bacterium]|nr:beta-propeller fold lactonase family protein [Acidobacteriaceae bacterium]